MLCEFARGLLFVYVGYDMAISGFAVFVLVFYYGSGSQKRWPGTPLRKADDGESAGFESPVRLWARLQVVYGPCLWVRRLGAAGVWLRFLPGGVAHRGAVVA